MNNENAREIYNILYNKSFFIVKWNEGAVLPLDHPNYYDGRINIKIIKDYDNTSGNINIRKEEYNITNEKVEALYEYIENNIDRITSIALKQNTETYAGVADDLNIKYKSLYISISGTNATNEEDYNEISNIKNNIKNILMQNK